MLLAIVLSLPGPGPAAAAGPALGPAPYAAPKVGARFDWRNVDTGDVGTAVVRGFDGVKRRWTFGDVQRVTIPFCTGCTEEGMIYPFEDYRALWPLRVGNVVTFRRQRDGDAWDNRVEVLGTETLDLEIGAVDVYVLDVLSEGVTFDVSTWRRSSRVWYAPSLSSAVRVETTLEDGRRSERRVSRWELVGHSVP